MNASIQRLDTRDPATVREFVESVASRSAADASRAATMACSGDDACVGAFVEGRLVAAASFVAHDVLLDGRKSIAFQLAWGATLPSERSKGLFRSIIQYAKAELAGCGASFLFGYADSVFEPLFVEKLGFTRIAMKSVFFPTRLPGASRRLMHVGNYFAALSSASIVRFNQYRSYARKKAECPELLMFENYTNVIWGRVVSRKIRFLGNGKVLEVGGCEINKPQLFDQLLKKIRAEQGVSLIDFVAAEGSMIASSSRIVRADATGLSFIYFPLRDLPRDVRFDAHLGMRDACR